MRLIIHFALLSIVTMLVNWKQLDTVQKVCLIREVKGNLYNQ